MSGMRFELGSFQETAVPAKGESVPSSDETAQVLSTLSSQTTDPVVDLPKNQTEAASFPAWVWLLLIPVILPFFLLLYRSKGAGRPASTTGRLDLRTQLEGVRYRDRIPPVFAKHDVPKASAPMDDDSDGSSSSRVDDFVDTSDEFKFNDDDIRDSGGSHLPSPLTGSFTAAVASRNSAHHTSSSVISNANAAALKRLAQLSEEFVLLRKELVSVQECLAESQVNDKLPMLELELEESHERFRQVELQRKALAKQLDESNQASHRLSTEIELLRSEIKALKPQGAEANGTANEDLRLERSVRP